MFRASPTPPAQGVIEFSLCLLFAKLVSYTFLYWLPLYIFNVGESAQTRGVRCEDCSAPPSRPVEGGHFWPKGLSWGLFFPRRSHPEFPECLRGTNWEHQSRTPTLPGPFQAEHPHMPNPLWLSAGPYMLLSSEAPPSVPGFVCQQRLR